MLWIGNSNVRHYRFVTAFSFSFSFPNAHSSGKWGGTIIGQWLCLQLDFQLPDRFELYYSAEDEAKREKPVMIHRAVLGSVERMFAILLEHYKGKWPFWLSPRQAIVCPVSEKSQPYALKVILCSIWPLLAELFSSGIWLSYNLFSYVYLPLSHNVTLFF